MLPGLMPAAGLEVALGSALPSHDHPEQQRSTGRDPTGLTKAGGQCRLSRLSPWKPQQRCQGTWPPSRVAGAPEGAAGGLGWLWMCLPAHRTSLCRAAGAAARCRVLRAFGEASCASPSVEFCLFNLGCVAKGR